MRSTKASLPFLRVAVLFTMSSAAAHAQAPFSGGDKIAAEALFEDARKLVAEGKYADACLKFAESERLDGSPSTLLNLASCWEKLGRTATAWAAYKAAESAASGAHRPDYADAAARHARALAPTLARLTIAVQQPVDGMQVKRDGVVVGPAEWGFAIPIDAGAYTIEASAPGYKPWALRIDVPHDGAQATATVPSLEAADVKAPVPKPATDVRAPLHSAPLRPPESTSNGSTQVAIALAVGGVGVAGLAVSGLFALVAKNKYDDSIPNCEASNHNLCTLEGIFQRDGARSMGNAATVAFGLGAAAIVAGGVLWVTAPRGPSPAIGATFRIVPTVGGIVAAGAW